MEREGSLQGNRTTPSALWDPKTSGRQNSLGRTILGSSLSPLPHRPYKPIRRETSGNFMGSFQLQMALWPHMWLMAGGSVFPSAWGFTYWWDHLGFVRRQTNKQESGFKNPCLCVPAWILRFHHSTTGSLDLSDPRGPRPLSKAGLQGCLSVGRIKKLLVRA